VTAIVRIHPEAKVDLRQARDYYRDIYRELALRLLEEYNVAVHYIRGFPNAGSPLFESYRHVVLPHFPYMVVYQVVDEIIYILAVTHLRRDPVWMKRELVNRT